MTLNPDVLRDAMRFWSTGVAVVTAKHNHIQHGMTVSSFTSLSLTPPQVLVSLARNTRTHDLVMRSEIFGVSVLNDNQQDISDRFAGRVPDDLDRLEGIETFTLKTGISFIKGGLAHFDCCVVTTLGSGTHTIFIGEVLAAQHQETGQPLMYFNRDYRHLS